MDSPAQKHPCPVVYRKEFSLIGPFVTADNKSDLQLPRFTVLIVKHLVRLVVVEEPLVFGVPLEAIVNPKSWVALNSPSILS